MTIDTNLFPDMEMTMLLFFESVGFKMSGGKFIKQVWHSNKVRWLLSFS